jgi:hypothetical protein
MRPIEVFSQSISLPRYASAMQHFWVKRAWTKCLVLNITVRQTTPFLTNSGPKKRLLYGDNLNFVKLRAYDGTPLVLGADKTGTRAPPFKILYLFVHSLPTLDMKPHEQCFRGSRITFALASRLARVSHFSPHPGPSTTKPFGSTRSGAKILTNALSLGFKAPPHDSQFCSLPNPLSNPV